jgi:hypothetical protein
MCGASSSIGTWWVELLGGVGGERWSEGFAHLGSGGGVAGMQGGRECSSRECDDDSMAVESVMVASVW